MRFTVLQVTFFSLKFVGIVFISSSYDFITLSQIIVESSIILSKYFPFLQIHSLQVQLHYKYIHIHEIFLHSHQHLLLFHHWFKLQSLLSNLHLHLHDISFVNVFDSFTLVIMLNTLSFKSSVLFGIHSLLDKSFRVFQLPTNLFNLIENG